MDGRIDWLSTGYFLSFVSLPKITFSTFIIRWTKCILVYSKYRSLIIKQKCLKRPYFSSQLAVYIMSRLLRWIFCTEGRAFDFFSMSLILKQKGENIAPILILIPLSHLLRPGIPFCYCSQVKKKKTCTYMHICIPSFVRHIALASGEEIRTL